MSEVANYDTSTNGNGTKNSIIDSNNKNLIFQILITLSLIMGPIFLPFILMFPESFSWLQNAKEISIVVLLLFVFTSIMYARLK